MKQCLKWVQGGSRNASVLRSQTHYTGLGLGQFASGALDKSALKSSALAARFTGVCNAKRYQLVSHGSSQTVPGTANPAAPVLSIRGCDTYSVLPSLEDISVLGFLPRMPTEC